MIRIGHYADIQVKIRENDLYKLSYEANLCDISNKVKEEKLDIVVIAGDLWEFYDVNDAERLVIYNHIADLLNIETLKEVVIMLGNHDLPSEKKVKEITRTNNPLDTLYKFISEISPKLLDKLTYLKNQQITDSKAYDGLSWIPFSLEGGKSNGNIIRDYIEVNPLDPNRKYITIYHDILEEYVEQSGLPISDSVRKRLANMDMFPTSETLAGDIHELWSIKTEDNKLFFYPGSSQQRNFGEGTYTKIREKISYEDSANKFMLIHEYSDSFEYIETKNVVLCDFIKHITIDIMSSVRHDNILESIQKALDNFTYGTYQTFIKIKSSNIYLDDEIKIMELIKKNSANFEGMTEVLPIAYEKVINDKVSETNKVIEVLKTLDSVEPENESEKESLSIINLDNVENLTTEIITDNFENVLLSKNKLIKLFESLIEVEKVELVKLLPSDVSYEVIVEELVSLFKEQIEFALNSSPNYRVKLLSVATNNFMPLGENSVMLNIPGLTKIEATNGRGKTSLYTLIYWTIRGKAFEYLKDSQAVKNNLHVFNDERPDLDTVVSLIKGEINGSPVTIKRFAVRKWKAKATDEDKASLNWKNFVSGISADVEVTFSLGGEIVKRTGVEAQELINRWFGNVPETILFLNQFKINQLLNKSSDELQKLTLDYIGIDYINVLIQALPSIKESMGVIRPKRTKSAIKLDLDRINEDLVKINDIDAKEKLIEESTIKFNQLEEHIADVNDELISIGNVEKDLVEERNTLDYIENEIKNFVRHEPKELPVLNQSDKPESFDKSVYENKIQKVNDEINENVLIRNNAETLITDNNNACIALIKNKVDMLSDVKRDTIETYIGENKKEVNQLTSVWENLKTFLNNSRETIQEDIKPIEQVISQIDFNVDKLNKDNIEIEDNLKNTLCSECGKPFNDNPEEHKKYIDSKNLLISTNKNKIEKLKNLRISKESHLKECVDILTFLSNIIFGVSKSIPQNILDYQNTLQFFDSASLTNIITSTQSLLEINVRFDELKLDEINLTKGIVSDEVDAIKIKTIDDNINKLFNLLSLLEHKKFDSVDVSFANLVLNKDSLYHNLTVSVGKYNESVEIITNKVNELDRIKSEYNTAITNYNQIIMEYQNKLDIHMKEIDEVNKYNLNITKENNRIIELNTNRNLVIERIEELSTQLPIYFNLREKLEKLVIEKDSLKIKLNDESDMINELKLKIKDINFELDRVNEEYKNYIEYEKAKAKYTIYETIIAKKFKIAVFAYYRQFLNVTFNILLENMNFKLHWNEDGNLYYIKFKEGKQYSRPVQLVSGMETCFLGLALTYAIHTLNIKNNISHIFIDEISGQLNSGKELVDENNSINYQEQLLDLLSKFEGKSIFIIDHVIKDMYQTVTYSVTRSENNTSIYEEI